MFRTISLALAAGAALMAAPALAQGSPVAGTWDAAVDLQGTKITSEITIAQAAGGYTVAIKDGPFPGAPADAPPMQSTISDVKVEGSNFSFKRTIQMGDMPMELSYAGSVSGNSMTAEVTSPMGGIPLTATRK